MELASHARVCVEGNKGHVIQCQRAICLNLGLNSRYTLTLRGYSATPLNGENFSHVVIRISAKNGVVVYHGELLSLNQEVASEGELDFCLHFGCSLHRLDNVAQQKLFIDQTLEEIISSLLSAHGIKAVFDWHNSLSLLPYTAQGGVCDYDFLIRLLLEHGLIFYYRHDEQQAMLHITDGVYPDHQHRLRFNPGNGLVEEDAAITSLHYHCESLPDKVRLRGAREDRPNHIFQTQTENTTDIPGHGVLNLSHQHVLTSQADCDHHALCLQQQLDWQREWLQIEGHGVSIQAGDRVQVEGYPQDRANGMFRALNVDSSFDNKANTNEPHPYRQSII